MIKWRARGRRVSVAGVLTTIMALAPCGRGIAADTGQQIFQGLCTACHTIGKGKLIGPDLAGVTARREESWLQRQIKEPDKLLAEGDPVATQLLKESNNVPMAPLGLTDDQVGAVIAYLKSTEQQTEVAAGAPPQYLPTIIAGLAALFGVTIVSLRAGKKNVAGD